MTIIQELLLVPNLLTLTGIAVAIASLVGAYWFFHFSRRIRVIAEVVRPHIYVIDNKIPFSVRITNLNTRQVKIDGFGFEIQGLKDHVGKRTDYEHTLRSCLLKTEKLLVPEGDSTEIYFDGFALAYDTASYFRDYNLHAHKPRLDMWIYITHGRRVRVQIPPQFCDKLLAQVLQTESR